MGALPQLYAALAPSLVGGELVGPAGMGHLRGAPAVDRQAASEDDQQTAARLWEVSVELTGVDYAQLQTSEQPAETGENHPRRSDSSRAPF
jgi:protochlorophyllide reductase